MYETPKHTQGEVDEDEYNEYEETGGVRLGKGALGVRKRKNSIDSLPLYAYRHRGENGLNRISRNRGFESNTKAITALTEMFLHKVDGLLGRGLFKEAEKIKRKVRGAIKVNLFDKLHPEFDGNTEFFNIDSVVLELLMKILQSNMKSCGLKFGEAEGREWTSTPILSGEDVVASLDVFRTWSERKENQKEFKKMYPLHLYFGVDTEGGDAGYWKHEFIHGESRKTVIESRGSWEFQRKDYEKARAAAQPGLSNSVNGAFYYDSKKFDAGEFSGVLAESMEYAKILSGSKEMYEFVQYLIEFEKLSNDAMLRKFASLVRRKDSLKIREVLFIIRSRPMRFKSYIDEYYEKFLENKDMWKVERQKATEKAQELADGKKKAKAHEKARKEEALLAAGKSVG